MLIELKCIVQDSLPDNVGKILWYHNGQLLDKNDDKNSITFQVNSFPHFTKIMDDARLT